MAIDYEAEVQVVYESMLRPGMAAIDVGAHVGRHAFEMARLVSPGGRVLMLEPIPHLFAQLSQAVRVDPVLSSVAEVRDCALSDTVGQTEFCIAVDAPGYSGMRERRYDVPTRVEKITVPVQTLDMLVAETGLQRVDYIKIDTEGAEWNVIKGASGTIAGLRPVITFEFGLNSYSAFSVDPVDVHRFFSANSYVVLDILRRRLDEKAFANSSVTQEVWDYIAVPAEKAAAFEVRPT